MRPGADAQLLNVWGLRLCHCCTQLSAQVVRHLGHNGKLAKMCRQTRALPFPFLSVEYPVYFARSILCGTSPCSKLHFPVASPQRPISDRHSAQNPTKTADKLETGWRLSKNLRPRRACWQRSSRPVRRPANRLRPDVPPKQTAFYFSSFPS